MGTIDEIMCVISRYVVAVGEAKTNRELSAVDDDRASLRNLIAAALADAERKGAEAMRESAAVTAWSSGMDQHNKRRGIPHKAREVGSVCAQAIRALPLPTGGQS